MSQCLDQAIVPCHCVVKSGAQRLPACGLRIEGFFQYAKEQYCSQIVGPVGVSSMVVDPIGVGPIGACTIALAGHEGHPGCFQGDNCTHCQR